MNPNNFIGGGAFYPIIMNYLFLLIGLKETLIRAQFGSESIDKKLERLLGKPIFLF